MKRILLILFVLISVCGYSQNIKVIGPDTTTGRPGYLFTLKPQYTNTPLYALNDSTLGSHAIDSLKRPTGTDSVYGRKDGVWVYQFKDSAGGGGGSGLTSVGLTMPSAFTVSNSPLIANGTIGVVGAGTTSQYIRGDGSLATTPAWITNDSLAVRKSGSTTNLIHIISHNSGYNSLTVGSSSAAARIDSANLFLGVRSGLGGTTGYSNVFLGRGSGKSNTTGYSNIAIGDSAMSNSTVIGYQNIGIGSGAARGLTSGRYNVFVGYETKPTSTPIGTIVVGGNMQGTAQGTLTGNGNIILGWRLFEAATSANHSIIIGGADDVSGSFPYKTGAAITTAAFNVLIGHGANSAGTGANNVALGTYALNNNNGANTGITALGYQALGGSGPVGAIATGSTAVGYLALGNHTTGAGNTAVGYRAMWRAAASSSYNTIMGFDAGQPANAATVMNYNVVYGANTVFASSGTLEDNAIFGYALNSVGGIAGSRNVFLGTYDYNSTNISGNDNISIGSKNRLQGTSSASNQFLLGSNNIRWFASDLSGTLRQWKLNGTSSTFASTTQGVILDVNGTEGGFLMPYVTNTQRNAIVSGGVSTGTIAGGSGYTNNTYTSVSLTGGSGTGAVATITVAVGAVTSVTITTIGTNYIVGDVLTGTGLGAGSGFTYTVTAIYGTSLMVFNSTSNSIDFRNTNNSYSKIYGHGYALATDAAYTITDKEDFVNLPTITSNRVVTVPSAATYINKTLVIKVANSAGFTWSSSLNLYDNADATFTTLANDTVYTLRSDGTNWYVLSKYP